MGSRHICTWCGRVAAGFAFINNDRYCHGDNDQLPTCYEKAQHARAWARSVVEAVREQTDGGE